MKNRRDEGGVGEREKREGARKVTAGGGVEEGDEDTMIGEGGRETRKAKALSEEDMEREGAKKGE
ncbi:MAG: hypothetical protein AUJ19_03730 [Parcubacteria group bacterium CG1_02_58_44]|nr:MAG: hypothetical protein AUJ19_03730 [Parcubacteria group bacterium CG1_02_58_44]